MNEPAGRDRDASRDGGVLPRPAPGEVHLHTLAFTPRLLDHGELADWLAPGERVRAAHLRFAEHRARFVLAHAFLRSVLARYLGLAPRAVRLAADAAGRPLLLRSDAPPEAAEDPAAAVRAEADLFCSLAHSRRHAAVAVAGARYVGVDVEERRPEADPLAIARRFLAPEEAAALAAQPAERRASAFLHLWACKEAFVKAIGLGLRYPLDRFVVAGLDGAQPRYGRIEPLHGAPEEWSLSTWAPATGCWAAVAWRARPGAVRRFATRRAVLRLTGGRLSSSLPVRAGGTAMPSPTQPPASDPESELGDLLQPTLAAYSTPAGAPPWRLGSQVWIGLLGGALAAATIAWLNAGRLGVEPRRRRWILAAGALGVLLTGAAAWWIGARYDVSERPGSSILRLAGRVWGLLTYLAVARIQQPGDRAFRLFDPRDYASLWLPGAAAVVLLGLLQAIPVVTLARWVAP